MRRFPVAWAVIALVGLVAGMAYRFLADPAEEANFGNYLRSGLHGAGLGLAGWAVHLYFLSRRSQWLRRWPLLVELIVRALAFALVLAAVALVLQALLYLRPLGAEWVLADYPRILAITLVFALLIGSLDELVRLVGGRALLTIAIGRYRRPVREERVVMFLDLVDSTALAEELGELRTQELITRLFADIDRPIRRHGGEVHAYLGDGAVVTWPLAAGASDGRALACFFAVEDLLAQNAAAYRRDFGAAPRFRAGLHAGPVVLSELGDSKRQIALFGDAMNVAARLQEQAKSMGRPLLASADLLRRLQPGGDLTIEALGAATLRGRSAPVEIAAISRRGAG